jgi:hypothetical protein
MSKRSRRLDKKNELRAVEEAIGASLGKSKAKFEADSQGLGREARREETVREDTDGLPTEKKAESR